MLTKKQKDLLLFIHDHMSDDDIAPSFEEMKEALGLKSKSGIHRLITGLVERGYIERLPHRARALEIKRLPDGFKVKPEQESHTHVQTPSAANTDYSTQEIPLMGKIAAGTPIEAIRHDGDNVSVPQDMMGLGEHYALIVDGDSMVEAGINDGDTVIIKRCNNAENGAIIVALVDGEDVTLKTLRRSGNKVILEPQNSSHEPQVLDPERVQIQGRLVSLMRSYH